MCAVIDELGGVDGIVGFSQGGELACLVAEAAAAAIASSERGESAWYVGGAKPIVTVLCCCSRMASITAS